MARSLLVFPLSGCGPRDPGVRARGDLHDHVDLCLKPHPPGVPEDSLHVTLASALSRFTSPTRPPKISRGQPKTPTPGVSSSGEAQASCWGTSSVPLSSHPRVSSSTPTERQLISTFERDLAATSGTGMPTNLEVEVGMPTDVLSELSDEIDLLVIGSWHASPRGRVQPGSTGRGPLGLATCPVLVVPRPAAGA